MIHHINHLDNDPPKSCAGLHEIRVFDVDCATDVFLIKPCVPRKEDYTHLFKGLENEEGLTKAGGKRSAEG